MKSIILFATPLIVCILLFQCKIQKPSYQQNANSKNCSYCDSIQLDKMFNYELREVHRNLEGVSLIPESESVDLKDSIRAFTEFQVKDIESSLFCFLGIKKDSIDELFHSEIHRETWQNNTDRISISYFYNQGNFVENKSSINKVHPMKNDQNEFWLYGGGNFMLEFSKIGGNMIFTGTLRDSILMENCLNKTKKE